MIIMDSFLCITDDYADDSDESQDEQWNQQATDVPHTLTENLSRLKFDFGWLCMFIVASTFVMSFNKCSNLLI